MQYTRCFVGALRYLGGLRHSDREGYVRGLDGSYLLRTAFPLSGNLPARGPIGSAVFQDEPLAFEYLRSSIEDEMRDRLVKVARRATMTHRLLALMHFHSYIEAAPHVRALRIAEWNHVNRVSLPIR